MAQPAGLDGGDLGGERIKPWACDRNYPVLAENLKAPLVGGIFQIMDFIIA